MASAINAAQRRYRLRILAASLAYVATLIIADHVDRQMLAMPLRFCLVLLPALSLVAMFVSLGAYIVEERDEFLRMRIVRQSVWATGFALTLATLWGFPEDDGLLPHLPLYVVAILWYAGFGLAAIAAKLTDR